VPTDLSRRIKGLARALIWRYLHAAEPRASALEWLWPAGGPRDPSLRFPQ
jgi:hypothetical protein